MGVFTRATASRSRTRTATLSGLAFLGASALVLTGCASPGGGEGGDNEKPAGDLTLKIGTLLPQTGNLAFLGPPEEAGVGLAVKEINDADLGIKVDVTYGDSGDPDNKAYATEVPRLLQARRLGDHRCRVHPVCPSSFIDEVTGAGVIQFSPANTSPDFTTWDDNGLYWRTAPSDLLQGEVLGNLIAEDGSEHPRHHLPERLLRHRPRRRSRARRSRLQAARSSTSSPTTPVTRRSTRRSARSRRRTPMRSSLIAFEETKTIVPGSRRLSDRASCTSSTATSPTTRPTSPARHPDGRQGNAARPRHCEAR